MNTERRLYSAVYDCVSNSLSGNGILPVNITTKGYINFIKKRYKNPSKQFWYDTTNDISIHIMYKIKEHDPEKSSLQVWINYQVLGWITSFVRHIKVKDKVEVDLQVDDLLYELADEQTTPESMIMIKDIFTKLEKDSILLRVVSRQITHLRASELEGVHINTIYRRMKKYKKLVDRMYEHLNEK